VTGYGQTLNLGVLQAKVGQSRQSAVSNLRPGFCAEHLDFLITERAVARAFGKTLPVELIHLSSGQALQFSQVNFPKAFVGYDFQLEFLGGDQSCFMGPTQVRAEKRLDVQVT
jgi:hypothetical protein